jgi:phosphatidylglycerol lysyltransferase
VDDRVLALVKRFGWNATSFQALEHGFSHFWAGDDACVAYVDTGAAWVAAGAPLAEEGRLEEVARAFLAAAEAAGRRACFFAVEERFVARFVAASGCAAIAIGEQAVWEPAAWPDVVARSGSLREQLRRARAKGVTVRRASDGETRDPASPLGRALRAIAGRWLRTRELAPMGFLVNVQPLTLLVEHRVYVAEREGVPVAFLLVAPIYARDGWLLQHLLRVPEAPNGVSELLIDAAMRDARDEGRRFVTLGLSPLAGEVPGALRAARALGRALYDFAGLRAFRAKLSPGAWVPQYLCFPRAQGAAHALRDTLAAFARGSLARFALETLARGPRVIVWLLALLLIPWTALLVAAPARWFPSPWVQAAWVAFDLVLVGAMFSLARRWRAGLANALIAATAADAVVTTAEVLAWNAPRGLTAFETAMVLVACAAPALACAALVGARRRRA